MFQILDTEGRLVSSAPDLPPKELLELYRLMVLTREFDRRALALQRQGRIGTYATVEGQEAAQVGSAFALEHRDWAYPSYREHGVQLTRGMPIEVILSYWKGLPNAEWDPHRYRTMIVSVPIASHLPHAVGHAYAARLAGEDLAAIAYFGDGATSASDFHSGLNFAGVWRTPTVFFCQNNLYAISVPYHKQTAAQTIAQKAEAYGIHGMRIDGMDVLAAYVATKEALRRARAGEGPTLIEALTYRYGPHATADDPRRYRSEAEESEWRARDPIERFRRYLESRGEWSAELDATIRGEVEDGVERAITTLEAAPLPGRDTAIRHVYARIPQLLVDELHEAQRDENEPETPFAAEELWSPLPEATPGGERASWTMAEAINAALTEAMERRAETVVLGEDVGVAGGVFRLTEGLHARFGEDRVIDTPLNESGIVGTAIGMAIGGARPVAEIQFDGFVYPAFDQLVSHLGRMRFRTRGQLTLPVVVRFPSGAGIRAHEHHCDSPEGYFVHAPGLVVVMPATPIEAKGLLAAALESEDPVLFLEPKVLYRAEREDVPRDHYTIPLGVARLRRPGEHVTVVAYGALVPVCLDAADRVASKGISAEVIDLRTLFPWDTATVLASVERTGRLVVVQEPPRSAGVAAEVAATVAARAIYSLQAPIERVTGFDAPWPQFAVEQHALVGPDRVAAAVERAATA